MAMPTLWTRWPILILPLHEAALRVWWESRRARNRCRGGLAMVLQIARNGTIDLMVHG
jgi:hypothetical protein